VLRKKSTRGCKLQYYLSADLPAFDDKQMTNFRHGGKTLGWTRSLTLATHAWMRLIPPLGGLIQAESCGSACSEKDVPRPTELQVYDCMTIKASPGLQRNVAGQRGIVPLSGTMSRVACLTISRRGKGRFLCAKQRRGRVTERHARLRRLVWGPRNY
jgi:hypothetical protein